MLQYSTEQDLSSIPCKLFFSVCIAKQEHWSWIFSKIPLELSIHSSSFQEKKHTLWTYINIQQSLHPYRMAMRLYPREAQSRRRRLRRNRTRHFLPAQLLLELFRGEYYHTQSTANDNTTWSNLAPPVARFLPPVRRLCQSTYLGEFATQNFSRCARFVCADNLLGREWHLPPLIFFLKLLSL